MNSLPPRLLTGVALLFWGGLTGHTLLGLVAAIAVEARSWLNLRWNFKKSSYVRAWHLSVLSAVVTALLAWFNGMPPTKIHTLFVWVPLFLLPLELAQRYGNDKQIPLNIFSFLARRKRQHDILLGRESPENMFNTGYAYIVMVILATALGSHHETYHFIGLSIILTAGLFHVKRSNKVPLVTWSTALIITLALAFAIQWTAISLIKRYRGSSGLEPTDYLIDANESRTSIGKLGQLKLSPKIFWRMEVEKGATPNLISTAVYNNYVRAVWKHKFKPNDSRDDQDYKTPEKVDYSEENNIHYFSNDLKPQPTPDIHLLGAINENLLENPIPLPHGTFAVITAGKETGLESNSLGTVRMHNSDYNVVEYGIWRSDSPVLDEPATDFDQEVPDEEMEAIRRVNTSLGLRDKSLTDQEKIRILKHFFQTQFTYTTHLKSTPLNYLTRNTAIGTFLEHSRAGHCEYFATATSLLLRDLGIPTRYCVGFSVHEKNQADDQWLIRGTAAHAWCRVWIDNQWHDLDFTPSSWQAQEAINAQTWQRKLSDWWQLAREDFLLWRVQARNKNKVFIALSVGIALIAIWLFWRLWTSRQNSPQTRYQYKNKRVMSALSELEPLIAKKIGPRPLGQPLCQWITELIVLDDSLTETIEKAVKLHSIIRFDPQGGSPKQHQELEAISSTLLHQIKQI
ncbi:MAG: transglutaminase domain-containing protein [Akkermansiaceae bacterium]